VKDANGVIVEDHEKLMKIWKKYYKRANNEEIAWNKDNLEEVNPVSGPSEDVFNDIEGRSIDCQTKIKQASYPSGVAGKC